MAQIETKRGIWYTVRQHRDADPVIVEKPQGADEIVDMFTGVCARVVIDEGRASRWRLYANDILARQDMRRVFADLLTETDDQRAANAA
ncbi:hypothetical protein [Thioalkalivibrio thiocyanodenitrificans]|uniref:hypothetical protein n=1 Tax=Thioalkalivibrio thiocyanodenitrificans TaxID=243063 RepID=UPI000376639C|nr:hypothetical protein [Thioalkalivibrio thiocyanodenitrificans]